MSANARNKEPRPLTRSEPVAECCRRRKLLRASVSGVEHELHNGGTSTRLVIILLILVVGMVYLAY